GGGVARLLPHVCKIPRRLKRIMSSAIGERRGREANRAILRRLTARPAELINARRFHVTEAAPVGNKDDDVLSPRLLTGNRRSEDGRHREEPKSRRDKRPRPIKFFNHRCFLPRNSGKGMETCPGAHGAQRSAAVIRHRPPGFDSCLSRNRLRPFHETDYEAHPTA